MNYYVRLNITNKEYICTHSQEILHGKPIIVDKPKLNPTGLEVVETIISKLGISRIYRNPNVWKKDYLDEFNNNNGTNHPFDMSFDDFLKILEKDGTIIIVYLEEEKEIKEEEIDIKKYIPF